MVDYLSSRGNKKKNKLYYKSIKIKCMRTKKDNVSYRNQLWKLMRVTEKKDHAQWPNHGKQTQFEKIIVNNKKYH